MTHEEFVAKVESLEELAGRDPSKYKLRVALFAALGYAYILFVLAAIALLILTIVYFLFAGGKFNFYVLKFGWVLLTFAFIVIRAMFVRLPPPEGIELRREDAPRLFALVDELTTKLDAPRVHIALVNDEYNAALAQVPRLGAFGWHKNYLLLGLPLMQALSPEHFRAVLAHELGHLSGNHGRFGSWIYRIRATWFQLLARLEAEDRWGSGVFVKFLNWYAPHFNAYTFVLARAQEHEADRASAQLMGARTVAEALATVDVKATFLSDKYWSEVFKQADTQPEPTRGAFAGMSRAFGAGIPPQDAEVFFRASLARETSYDDTHPSLAARLAALGFRLDDHTDSVGALIETDVAPLELSAAEHFLGAAHERLAERLDASWFEATAPQWRERHKYVNESRQKLAALDEKAVHEKLGFDEEWQRACWTAEFRDAETAIPLFREVLERRPHHPDANFALGQMLIERDDAEGITHIERAMKAEPQSVPAGCQLLYGFLRRQGRETEAVEYRRRLFKHFDQVERAQQERAAFKDGDELLPHAYTNEELTRLREQLRRYTDVKEAFLARKKVEEFPDKPLHVLGVITVGRWFKLRSNSADGELLKKLINELEFPGETYVLLLKGFGKTKKAMRATEGALIYQK